MERIIKIFPYLLEEDLFDLMRFSEIVSFKKDTTIIEYGKYNPNVYFVINGLVRGYQNLETGEEHNIYFTEENHFFMSPQTFFQIEKRDPNLITFKSVSNVSLLKINYHDLLHRSKYNPRLYELHYDFMKSIIKILSERINLLIIEDTMSRYLQLTKKRPVIIKHAKKKHIAQFLGITPNSFSRLIKNLKGSSN